MPLNIPELKEIVDRVRADVVSALPDLDPTIVSSFIRALVDSLAARVFESNLVIGQLADQSFPQTATDEFLERWAGYDGISRNPATKATGDITATGTLTTIIPVNTELNSQTAVLMETTKTVTISNILTSIASLTRVNTTVTAVCVSAHRLASGISAEISGASEETYDGTFVMTVIDDIKFTYEITTTPGTIATGAIVNFDGALIPVETDGIGLDQNVGSGAGVNFVSPLAGLDVSAFVGPAGIDGGAEIEADEDLRLRVLQKRATIESLFNPAILMSTAKTVSGVTRVFVKEITKVITPTIGAVSIYFMRDGDSNPIPSSVDVQNVNDKIQVIRPAHTDIEDVVVLAPTAKTINIQLSSIDPDTTTMRENIILSLEDYFRTFVDFEQEVLSARIETALLQAQDIESGEFLTSFSLDAPGDTPVPKGEIGVLGTVTIT